MDVLSTSWDGSLWCQTCALGCVKRRRSATFGRCGHTGCSGARAREQRVAAAGGGFDLGTCCSGPAYAMLELTECMSDHGALGHDEEQTVMRRWLQLEAVACNGQRAAEIRYGTGCGSQMHRVTVAHARGGICAPSLAQSGMLLYHVQARIELT